MNRYFPEILAPCGTPAAFQAALRAGADAMYMALKQFGARAYAANFDVNELLQAIEEAHLHERKIYLTLNTLLRDEELKKIPELMDPLYREGLDAVLVQDLGLYRLLRERYPELPLHASTQMNLCSAAGARYAKSLGFTRVVPARELTIEELAEIRKSAEIEVEAFVHGAMCYCYSGRCYLSSFYGGRSGNRGRCAQPCRQKIEGRYPLSMKDLCTLRDIPLLMDAGIDSFKIEGRMKNEYYVAACVDAYKSLAEDYRQGCFSMEKAVQLEERLAEVFNRGGFTHGYLKQVSGPEMVDDTMPGRAGVPVGRIDLIREGTVGFTAEKTLNRGDSIEIRISPEKEPVRLTVPESAPAGKKTVLKAPGTRQLSCGMTLYRVKNARLMHELEDQILNRPARIPVRLQIRLAAGEPLMIRGELDREEAGPVTMEGDMASRASSRPVSDPVIREKVGTLADTEFQLTELQVENDGKSFIPAGAIKALRRECLAKLKAEILQKRRREYPPMEAGERENAGNMGAAGLGKGPSSYICHVTSLAQARSLLVQPEKPAAIVFRNDLRAMDLKELRRFAENRKDVRFLVGFPAIYRSLIPEENMEELYQLSLQLDGVYLPGIDSYAWYRERVLSGHEERPEQIIFLGEALYAYNSRAAEHFTGESFGGRLWIEAPYELTDSEIPRTGAACIRTVYGRIPLMRTVQKPGKNLGEEIILYPVPDLWYNNLLSGRPVLADAEKTTAAYLFTVETEEMIRRILSGAKSEGEKTARGIRHKGLL